MRGRIIAATPMICIIIYLCFGFIGKLWHPSWVVFFLIPLMPLILGTRNIKHFYPLVCIAIYLIIGFAFKWWHPGWIIFLTIPVFYTLFPNRIIKRIE